MMYDIENRLQHATVDGQTNGTINSCKSVISSIRKMQVSSSAMHIFSEFKRMITNDHSRFLFGMVAGAILCLFILISPSLLELSGESSMQPSKSWLGFWYLIGAPSGCYVSWFIGASIGRITHLMITRVVVCLAIYSDISFILALYCFGDIIISLTFHIMFTGDLRDLKVRRVRSIATTFLVFTDLLLLHSLREQLTWFKITSIFSTLLLGAYYLIENNEIVTLFTSHDYRPLIDESEITLVETVYNTFISMKEALEAMFAIEDKNINEDDTIIGIDLGSSSSTVSVYRDGRVELLKIGDGYTLPSYVAFTADGQCLIGEAAKNQLAINPENTIFNSLQLIGRNFHDPAIQAKLKQLPYKVVEKNNRMHVQVNTNQGLGEYAPEQIIAMIIGRLKEIAEGHLKGEVNQAAITVPDSFNNTQRQAIINSGSIANLNVPRIINETTAAMIGSKDIDWNSGKKNVLVYKLGSGSFDVTLSSIDGTEMKVIARDGNINLGGDDFDERLVDYFIDLHYNMTGIYVGNDVKACQQLRVNVERAKCLLSIHKSCYIEINKNKYQLTRSKFEELNMDLFLSTMDTVSSVLNDADLDWDDVDEVVLAGGSTAIPEIQQLMRDFFEGKKFHYNHTKDAVSGGVGKQVGSEAVVVSEVSSLPLGVEVHPGVMSVVIQRNTTIPTKNTERYKTVFDNQTEVDINIYEGIHKRAVDNHFLGTFKLTGIPPAPAGVQKIDKTFQIDMNGILTVTAKNEDSGNQEFTVINYYRDRLSSDDIEQMKHTT